MSPRCYIDQIVTLHAGLRQTDLTPGPTVNELFSQLVHLALTAPGEMSDLVLEGLGDTLHDLRSICDRGETLLEEAWSRRIVSAADPWAELRAFPYFANYRRLVQLELGAVAAAGARPRRVTVVGSGPLPLTAVVMAAGHGLCVEAIEHDPHRLRLGQELIEALHLTPLITAHLADARAPHPCVGRSDLVVLAAMAGDSPEVKRVIIEAAARQMPPGTHLLVRTASGMRRLLYLPVEWAEDPVKGLQPVVELHPHEDVVNSVLVLRRQAPAAHAVRDRIRSLN